jgi:hypothetical protein
VDAADAFAFAPHDAAVKCLLEAAAGEANIRVLAVGEFADIGAEGHARELDARAGTRVAHADHLHVVGLRHPVDQPGRHGALVVGIVRLVELPGHVVVRGRGRNGGQRQGGGEKGEAGGTTK